MIAQAATETETETSSSAPSASPRDITSGQPSPGFAEGDSTYEGINIGGATVTQSTEHLPEAQRNLVRWLFNYARQEKLTWDEIAKATALDHTTLYRVWRDKYRHPKTGERISLDNVCKKIERYKNVVDQRLAVASDFVETSVWKRVAWLCDRAFVRQKIGFIFGESHIGKTTCLQEFQRRNNHGQTTYVEMPPSSGVQLMTKYIARGLFVSEKKSFDHLLEEVIQALDQSKLLIIDEIHRVFTTYQKGSVMRCLDVLRHIHDTTKCGLVLCGTNVFRDQLKRGEFAQYLKQLRRRGLYELQLPADPPREDLDALAASFGLHPASGEAEEVALNVAKQDGFAAYICRLQDAAELAAKKKQTVSWEFFIKAHDIVKRMALEVK